MANLLSGQELRKSISEGKLIIGGDENSVENMKYDFHMGSRVLKAVIGQPCEISDLETSQRFVDPGEAVFVLTREKLNLPQDIMVTLTPKRKLAHGGIMILGGLMVDPKYSGHLLIGLYNFSSTPFPLQPGKKIVGSMFYRLREDQIDSAAPTPSEIKDFPDELVSLIRNYKPIELNGIDSKLDQIAKDLENLKKEIETDKSWKDEFKNSLEAHNRQIDKLIHGIEAEAEVRKSTDAEIAAKLEGMQKSFFGLSLAKSILSAIALLILGAMTTVIVTQLMTPSVDPIQPPPTTRSPA
jgi:dCTP deaminase